MNACARACVHILSYIVINLFLAIIGILFKQFFSLVLLTLNYQTLNLNFIHLHVTRIMYTAMEVLAFASEEN